MNNWNVVHPITNKTRLLIFQILSLTVFAIYVTVDNYVLPKLLNSVTLLYITPVILIIIVILLRIINIRKIVIRRKDILYLILPFVITFTFTIVWATITGETSSSNGDAIAEVFDKINPLLFLLMTCIWAPITEELLFRKLLMGNVFYKHALIGLCVSSLGFGALHMLSGFTLFAFIDYTFAGVVYGCVYYFTKRIEISIIAHMISNSIPMILLVLMPK